MSAADVMFEAEVRVEAMIYLPGLRASEDSYPDVFAEEFCEWLPDREGDALYKQLPELKRFSKGDAPEPYEVAEALMRRGGFIVQAATPTQQHHGGGSYTSGWGCYYTQWLYAPTEAEIADVCSAWAEDMHAKDRAKVKAVAS